MVPPVDQIQVVVISNLWGIQDFFRVLGKMPFLLLFEQVFLSLLGMVGEDVEGGEGGLVF
jgi:hypothetical protein